MASNASSRSPTFGKDLVRQEVELRREQRQVRVVEDHHALVVAHRGDAQVQTAYAKYRLLDESVLLVQLDRQQGLEVGLDPNVLASS